VRNPKQVISIVCVQGTSGVLKKLKSSEIKSGDLAGLPEIGQDLQGVLQRFFWTY